MRSTSVPTIWPLPVQPRVSSCRLLLLPAGASTGRSAQDIFTQIGAACRAINVVVAGGHSEVTPAVSQPIVCGSLLGEVFRTKFVRSGGCRPGDLVLLAGQAPVEGTSIIAREMRDYLLDAGWSDTELDQAANYLFDPGISVLRPAVAAAEAGLVTAMHDPTEGGVATGLQEMAIASGTGLELDLDAVPVPDLARRLCAVFDLDPLGTIASGALLATTPPEKVDALIDVWRTLGWQGSVIGRVLPQDEGLRALRAGQTLPFPVFAVDEITKLWKT